MTQYQTLARDEHELSPSPAPARSDTLNDPSDPWHDGVIDVSARPRRVFSLHFNNLKCHVLIFFFALPAVPR